MYILNKYSSIDAITVAGHDGTKYICSIGSGQTIKGMKMIKSVWDHEKRITFDKYRNKVLNKEMTKQEAWREHSHEILINISKRFSWEYRRVEIN